MKYLRINVWNYCKIIYETHECLDNEDEISVEQEYDFYVSFFKQAPTFDVDIIKNNLRIWRWTIIWIKDKKEH